MIEDDPSDLVHDLAARCVFGEHELGRPVIGSAATVRGLTNAGIARATTRAATAPATSSSRPRATSSTTRSARSSPSA